MGNRTSTSRRQQQEGSDDGMSLFDIASLIILDRMPITPMTVPSCLDELVDWTEEATATANRLTHAGINVGINSVHPISFVPFVMTRKGGPKAPLKEAVNQRNITWFPKDCTFERTAFYHQDVLVCVVPASSSNLTINAIVKQDVYTFTGLNFCLYLKILRRLFQLVELDDSLSIHSSDDSETQENAKDDECAICMSRSQETVLPCLHGVCSICEKKWVETHMDCPFCRKQYKNARRRKRDQWQMENWSKKDAEKDMVELQQQIHSFWQQHAAVASNTNFKTPACRLERSFQESTVDDDFVLLH
jgi:hypothetical protein